MHHHTTMDSLGALGGFNHQIPLMADANNNSGAASGSDEATKKDEKYSLRQRQSRRSTPTAKPEKKTVPKEKPKQKAPPLSKYRRKTANARERTRMREINSAFENLRQAVPVAVAGSSGTSSPVSSPGQGGVAANEKLTKITTLRLAMKYIRILSEILNNEDGSSLMSLDNNNDLDMVNHNEIEREVMLKGALLSESIFKPVSSSQVVGKLPAEKSPSSKKSSSSSGSAASARKKSKKSTSKSNSSSRKSTSRSSKQAKLLEDKLPSIDSSKDDLMDLGMMLDSDNDSLNLSEPCLSPLQTTGLKQHQQQTFNAVSTAANGTGSTATDLEFGLFLESDADSLQLSEPCLSPLSHLDSLNPFNDLLHTGFNEQTALELYL